jgi:predicted dehydrogenase
LEPQKPIRFAVVGLGHFAQTAVLPAFARAKNSKLVALFSGNRDKLAELGARHGVEHALSYDHYDEFLRSGGADAVYIALPNSLHCEYTVRAAEASVHVLCEKPMALSSAECEAMIEACASARRKLMIAYRLHFEKASLAAIEIASSGQLGEIRLVHAIFCMQVRSGNIRTKAQLGGGPLYDIGVYCINAARSVFRAEPCEVTALLARRPDDERFREVEQQIGAVLRFPGEGLATLSASFNAEYVSRYEILGSGGRLVVDPAYTHGGSLKHELTIGGKTTRRSFAKSDQVAAEIVYFSNCILNDQQPEPSGVEGLCDVRVIEALFASARTGQTVQLEPFSREHRPRWEQRQHVPAGTEPEPVHAESPHS